VNLFGSGKAGRSGLRSKLLHRRSAGLFALQGIAHERSIKQYARGIVEHTGESAHGSHLER